MPKSSWSSATGAIAYENYRDNFVVLPGSEAALGASVRQSYAGQQHKLKATRSSNSEDAPTWSCFFAQEYEIKHGVMAAGAVLSVLPAIIVLLLAQRHIVKGLTALRANMTCDTYPQAFRVQR